MTTLLEAADTLYGLKLAEFTPARDALAKKLRATDRGLADEVKALKKPSTAAWVLNLLVRRDPAQVDQVLTVGAALREAQDALDGDELRALTRQRRQVTAAITRQARALAGEHGQQVTASVAEQVEATLNAAMVDAEAAVVVRTGLLLTAFSSTGLEPLDTGPLLAVPDATGFTATTVEAPESHTSDDAASGVRPPTLRVVPDPDEVAKRIAAATDELAAAERNVDTAADSLASARAEVADLEARSLQVQAEIDELRRRLAENEQEQDGIDDELTDAQNVVESARDDVRSSEVARSRAADSLARLSR